VEEHALACCSLLTSVFTQGVLLHHVPTRRWDLPPPFQSSEERLSSFGQQPVLNYTEFHATRRTKGCKSKLDQLHTPDTITNKDRPVTQPVRRTRSRTVTSGKEATAPVAAPARVTSPSPAARNTAPVDSHARPESPDQIW